MCIRDRTDNTPPTVTISCPADYSVNADGSCNADTTPTAAGEATATASDNCDATVTASVTYSDGAQTAICEGAYSFVRTWTASATDDCGNTGSSTCAQTITVNDNTPPTWDDYVPYVFASCEDLLDPEDPTQVPISASDNCSCLLYTSPSPRDLSTSRMPSSA